MHEKMDNFNQGMRSRPRTTQPIALDALDLQPPIGSQKGEMQKLLHEHCMQKLLHEHCMDSRINA